MRNECRVCKCINSFHVYEVANNKDGALCTVYICSNCFVLYNSALDEQQLTLNEFEAVQGNVVQNYYSPGVAEIANLRSEVQKSHGILEFLFYNSELNLKRRSLIDIGSGAGMLVAAASPYFERVYGSDLDISLTRRTVEVLGLNNISVVKDFEEINDEFDVVVLWHTLEHVHDPAEFIFKIKEKLSKNGIIYCQVPLYRKEYFVDGHLWFFNALTVEKIKIKYGFDKVIISFDPQNSYLTFCLFNL